MDRSFSLLYGLWLVTVFVVGVACFGTGVGYAVETGSLIHEGRRASGLVAQVENLPNDDDHSGYAVQVTYSVGGQRYELIVNTSFRVFSVGDHVSVLYPTSSPEYGRIDTFGQLWGETASFGLGALFSIVFGAGLLWWRRWQAATRAQRPAAREPPSGL